MERVFFILIVLTGSACLVSCRHPGCDMGNMDPGNWVKVSQLPLNGRAEAVSFTIGNNAYLGSGLDSTGHYLGDFWKFDPQTNIWEQLASLPPGAERSSAVGFSIANIGICGTGFNGSDYLNDFYLFDPETNTWTKINSSFPGEARSEAVAFSIGDSGYIGTGYDGTNALADFYKYDKSKNSWQVIPFNGQARYSAVAFEYNNMGYLVTGTNGDTLVSEFLVFDPLNNSAGWKRLNAITNASSDAFDDSYLTIVRKNSAAFVIGDRAYISTGETSGLFNDYTWEYDFASDLWTEKTPFEGTAVTGATGISVNNRGFLTTGKSQLSVSNLFWEFQPQLVENPNDN
jgi:N-acetylneuraminic acid mutarotase